MSLGLAFWIIMLILFVFSAAVVGGYGGSYGVHAGYGVGGFVDFVLFFLLGWRVFGPPLHS